MGDGKGVRKHSPEFKLAIVERMLAGENVQALAKQHKLPRSGMYRWRDAYRLEGLAGLQRGKGRLASGSAPPPAKRAAAGRASAEEQRLRQRVAELERKIGQQAVEIDFFKGVFKRLEELPKAKRRGGDASTPRS
jgi:transposase-like protein